MSGYTNRERMQAVLAGEVLDYIPSWTMGFFSSEMTRCIVPAEMLVEDLNYHPEGDARDGGRPYGFASHTYEELERLIAFNAYIDRVAVGVGRGANFSFGHAGPGEFNSKVVERTEEAGNGSGVVIEYETGAREKHNYRPQFTHPVSRPIRSMDDLETVTIPDPDDPARYAGFAEDVAYLKSRGEYTVGWVNGFFSGCHYFFREYESFLTDLIWQPALVMALMSLLGNWNLVAARHMLEAGVDCIAFCDDLGSSKNLLISPQLYKRFFLPWHAALADLVHGHGAVLHMHSHGNVNLILDDVVAAGIDMLNPLDPTEGMDIAAVRRRYPRLTLVGGMDKYIFDQEPDEIAARLAAGIEAAQGRKGRFILMDTGGIPDSVDREKFLVFRKLSREARGQSE